MGTRHWLLWAWWRRMQCRQHRGNGVNRDESCSMSEQMISEKLLHCFCDPSPAFCCSVQYVRKESHFRHDNGKFSRDTCEFAAEYLRVYNLVKRTILFSWPKAADTFLSTAAAATAGPKRRFCLCNQPPFRRHNGNGSVRATFAGIIHGK